jgi:hypothetical protein
VLRAVFSEPCQIVFVCLAGRRALGRSYIAEILCDGGIDCFAFYRFRFRFRLGFDISCKNSNFGVPCVQRSAGRRTNGLTFQLAVFPPSEIEVAALAAVGLTIDQDESRVWLSILPETGTNCQRSSSRRYCTRLTCL